MPEAPYPEEDGSRSGPRASPRTRTTGSLATTTQRARHQRDDRHRAEKPLFVLSNGVLVETKENADNTTTYHWKMNVPHVSYLISLAGVRFRRLSRPGRRPAGRLLRGQARRRGDGAAVHGQDARR